MNLVLFMDMNKVVEKQKTVESEVLDCASIADSEKRLDALLNIVQDYSNDRETVINYVRECSDR